MQAIRNGDLYFLESPFHSDMDPKLEKRLSYLLGTVSSRPAVVVRAPNWWDQYNTVTVIPALSKGDPAITFKLHDRYGCLTESDYPFMPHNPHTIPVSRLGKHIGSLDPDELEELLYAFHWIHDSNMQRNKTNPVPKIYKNLVEKPPMKSWKHNKDARSDVNIFVKPDMTLQSPTHPELDAMKLDINLRTSVNPKVLSAVENELEYYTSESPLVDTDVQKAVAKETAGRVPVERSFPPSIFSYDTLCNIAGRFTISDAYYKGEKAKREALLSADEIRNITKGTPVTISSIQILDDIYKKFTPMDAYLLGPRLPTATLANILGISTSEVVVLKQICNIMRDMSEDEYQSRLAVKSNTAKSDTIETVNDPDETADTVDGETVEGSNGRFKLYSSKNEISRGVRSLTGYLNPKRIMSIPPHLQETFVRLPKHAVRRQYQGKDFVKYYKLAMDKYLSILLAKEE